MNQLLQAEGLRIKRIPNLNLNSSEFPSYLTIGSGFVAVAKIFIDYIKAKQQTHKLSVKTDEGAEINIEGASLEEVEKLLQISKEIVIAKKNC